MKFYFNTPNQINGDTAYNEGNFEEAIDYYHKGLTDLQRYAATTLPKHTDFYDGLAYVLVDILTVEAQFISDSIDDFAKAQTHWQSANSLIQELDVVFSEKLRGKHNIETTEEVIQKVYSMLANACEEISDEIVDALESLENIHAIPSPTLAEATEWMQRAITYRQKANETIPLASHLGYLHLLEQQYKTTQNESALNVIANYINNHRLLEQPIAEPLQKLELLSYAIRVAVVKNATADIQNFKSACPALYLNLSVEDKENDIIADLQTLIELELDFFSHNLPSHTDETNDPPATNNSMEIVYTQLSEIVSASTAMEDNIPCFEQIPDVVAPMLLATHASEIPSSFPFLSAIDNCVSQESPMATEVFSKQATEQHVDGLQHRFFAPVSPIVVPSKTGSEHCQALKLGLNNITCPPVNPKYLANLLCLVADFFGKYRAKAIPKQDAILIAYDLYQNALKIYPGHRTAQERYQELVTAHLTILKPYHRFGSKPQVNNRDPRLEKLSQSLFSEGIEEMTTQLETLLLTDDKKLIASIKALVSYLGKNLEEGTITGSQRSDLKKALFSAFKSALSEPVNNSNLDNPTYS
ncbi:hypothetical protein [Legionella cardiaca]|uniref:Tetratricopeptide repeat protein n=1 Tax=Legionella cardiaca TaxID=1071983 RepID=A0ABY8APM6_9GAMM|nr:hypothetical protein [Legionella cardiaca]WED42664.1 hypothetical protein PXX05_12260 [Legionella cardiaca]